MPTPSVVIEAAPGELIDKITILEIKSERIRDAEKLRNVRTELGTLLAARDRTILPPTPCISDGRAAIGQRGLWEIEDEIRGCEHDGEFGPKFVELAVRSIRERPSGSRQAENQRAAGLEIMEEKSYASTSPPDNAIGAD